MKLVERDYTILHEIDRWNWLFSRHIKELSGFSGQRACDRRLKLLVDNEYIQRKKILYGVPSLYFTTRNGQKLIGVPTRETHVKIEQIRHDTCVLNSVVYFLKKYKIPLKDFTSEKQLHSLDGFSNRKHRPDFVFKYKAGTICVEIETSEKSKNRLMNNVQDNFMNYDYQFWIIPETNVKIQKILDDNLTLYPTMKFIKLEEVENYIRPI